MLGLSFATPALAGEYFAGSDTAVIGNLSNGSLEATYLADGSSQRLAEVKDQNGEYRLDWRWQITVDPGDDTKLRLVAQATNSRHGMDFYNISISVDGVSWHALGQVDQTTLTTYQFPLPDNFASGALTIKAEDSNQSGDTKRSNQLWIDELAIVNVTCTGNPLDIPGNLAANSAGSEEIALSWEDTSCLEDGFAVERSSGATGFQQVGTTGKNATTYLDSGLTTGTEYTYRVSAFRNDPAESSDPSETASATPEDGGGGGGGGGFATGPQTDRVIIGYYPSWAIYNARKYWVSHIPFENVTHVNYAFANVDWGTGEVIVGDTFAEETNRKDPETDFGLPAGNLHQLTHFRDIGHNGPAQEHLKIIISVGGWTWSDGFSQVAATPEGRGRFASSLRDFIQLFNLDGADIDWEFPTGNPADCGEPGNVCDPADPVNHALLLLAVAQLLGPDKELSIAMPVDPEKIARIMPPLLDNALLDPAVLAGDEPLFAVPGEDPVTFDPAMGTALDNLTYVHIMAYDMAGSSFGEMVRHHAPLFAYKSHDPGVMDPAEGTNLGNFNSHFAIQAYRHIMGDYSAFDPDADNSAIFGIPPDKLTFGMPMYGRGWKSVDSGLFFDSLYPGLFSLTDSSVRRRVPKGTWDGGKWGNTGVFAYWDIFLNYGGDGSSAVYDLIHV
ncbi:MAG: glycosyl hydrolase family 18 protein, partial [Kiloniellales bacterium]|nr:glycosyl hydrolase family 18 protein [Kiloniellales bacterium]